MYEHLHYALAALVVRSCRFVPSRHVRVLALLLSAISLTLPLPSPTACGEETKGIAELIAALISPNKPPYFPNRGSSGEDPPVFSPTYDRAAQRRVLAARDELLGKGIVAFPELVKNIRDKRYSCTKQKEPGFWVNQSVGSVCYDIIAVQVQVYEGFVRGSQAEQMWLRPGLAVEWWDQHKRDTLRDIQLEATQWAIDRERKKGFRSEREEAAILGPLDRLRQRLESSREPLPVDVRRIRGVDEDAN